ncbi:substrate-binding domain-containing protein [Pseudarthrobacter sp. NPDC058329]|uniref:substrate-binding domain-containing protein n=1 Tax=Pseudarthrobacter sp. NPDC058329 TaxID=3346448 RepID=UPI0036DAEA52
MGIGLMQELQAAGVKVPEAVSIVGFDDIFSADFTTPPLTTIRSLLRECGVRASARLFEDLAGTQGTPASLLQIETELIVRGSSGARAVLVS